MLSFLYFGLKLLCDRSENSVVQINTHSLVSVTGTKYILVEQPLDEAEGSQKVACKTQRAISVRNFCNLF